MILYHGTTTIVENPKILRDEKGRDFGFAFYTTDIKEQAERWAIRRAKVSNRNNIQAKPIVNIYEWDNTIQLNHKAFDGASMEWLDLVVRCRSEIDFGHNYDIVTGKIANDNVGETVSYVVRGIMRKEDAIERLKFEKINNQIAFCTEKSLETLRFIDSYEVEE